MRNTRSPILLATGDPMLSTRLANSSGVTLLESGCETLADCLEAAAASSPAGLVIGTAMAPWPGALLPLVQELRARLPDLDLAVLAHPEQLSRADNQAMQQSGATLLLYAESPVESFEAWARGGSAAGAPRLAAAPAHSAEPAPHPADPLPRNPAPPRRASAAEAAGQKAVAFWGGKPGAGRSTLITAVADLISRQAAGRVCTLDLNPFNSSLAALLRKESEPSSWLSLGESLRHGALTAQAVQAALVPVQPGWALLTGPAGSDQWCGLLTPQVVLDLLDLLRAEFDYILLDLPAGRNPAGDAALGLADQVLLVVSGFFPDVLDTSRSLDQAVAESLLSRDKCRLVLSQWVDSPELPRDDVSKCLGLPVAAQVPLAPAGALAAARTGRPATQMDAPEARPLADGARAVAALIGDAGMVRPLKRGWFGR